MLRSIVALAAACVLPLSACAGPAATPTSSPASSVVATAAPTTLTREAAPAATAMPLGTPTPASTPIAIRPGEPWLVFAWFPASLFLVRLDGSDRH
jgi:hypothetical protein